MRAEIDRPLRFLACGVNFPPEVVGIGKYTGEMCEWLAARGHEVRVIVPPPWYPDWKERSWAKPGPLEDWRGVKVRRVPLFIPKGGGGLARLAQAASFGLTSLPALAVESRRATDIVWVVAPSLGAVPGALLSAALGGAVSWLHVQDFEVDASFELDILGGRLSRSLALGLERFLLRRFDVVSTISTSMAGRLLAKGVDPARIVLLPNWVDLDAIHPERSGAAFREELQIPQGAVVAMYSGSMGKKQGVEILALAARGLEGDPSVHFVFCGGGTGRAELERFCAGLRNITWMPLQPSERLGDLLAMADIHLLPQRAGAADLMMPSKLCGMLASGRPVVATAEPGTAVGEIVPHAGLRTPPGNAAEFTAAILALAHSRELRERLGRAGRDFAEIRFCRNAILTSFESEVRLRIAVRDANPSLRREPT
jgi:colanic acid biosynthesis glycosyl transferase WcaI